MTPTIRELVDAAIDSEGLQRTQAASAAATIAQFLVIRSGLEGRIPTHDLSATAASLTAAIWAK